MTLRSLLVRFCAVAAPAFLFLYGVLRLVDGLDGDHGPGLAWNFGHTAFLVAFVLLGILVVGIRQLIPPATSGRRIVATVATVAALFGVACFLWVILGDLFARLRDAAPLPDPLEIAGPLLFQLGTLTLLIQLVTARPRRLPLWCPPLVFLGFIAIGINLDLLPVGAILIAAGLAPLAVARRSAVRTGSA